MASILGEETKIPHTSKTGKIKNKQMIAPLSLYPPQPLVKLCCFLSLWIYLLWVPPLNRVVWYLSFCDWFFSLGVIPTSFIHVEDCVNISFLVKAFHCVYRPHFVFIPHCILHLVYPFIRWWISSYFYCLFLEGGRGKWLVELSEVKDTQDAFLERSGSQQRSLRPTRHCCPLNTHAARCYPSQKSCHHISF